MKEAKFLSAMSDGSTDSGILEKLVAFGSDGASVMQGKKGGVVALLRLDTPWLQVPHIFLFSQFHDVFVFISRH